MKLKMLCGIATVCIGILLVNLIGCGSGGGGGGGGGNTGSNNRQCLGYNTSALGGPCNCTTDCDKWEVAIKGQYCTDITSDATDTGSGICATTLPAGTLCTGDRVCASSHICDRKNKTDPKTCMIQYHDGFLTGRDNDPCFIDRQCAYSSPHICDIINDQKQCIPKELSANDNCSVDRQCLSNICSDSTCATSQLGGYCKIHSDCTPRTSCVNGLCQQRYTCENGNPVDGYTPSTNSNRCKNCYSNYYLGTFLSGVQYCLPKKFVGAYCNRANECISGICSLIFKACANGIGGICTGDSHCTTLNCFNNICQCSINGCPCESDANCQGECCKNICSAIFTCKKTN